MGGVKLVRQNGKTMVRNSHIYTKKELQQLVVPLLAKYDMAQAHLFGSYARGEADETSDIDVLLVGNPGFRPLNIFGVAEELYRASGKDVDVYEISELNPGSFRDAVMKEMVRL